MFSTSSSSKESSEVVDSVKVLDNVTGMLALEVDLIFSEFMPMEEKKELVSAWVEARTFDVPCVERCDGICVIVVVRGAGGAMTQRSSNSGVTLFTDFIVVVVDDDDVLDIDDDAVNAGRTRHRSSNSGVIFAIGFDDFELVVS